jgi:hypothetical protein
MGALAGQIAVSTLSTGLEADHVHSGPAQLNLKIEMLYPTGLI